MKRSIPLIAAVLTWAVVLQPGFAQDDFKLEKGFTSLFNGKDLDRLGVSREERKRQGRHRQD